MHYCDRDHGLGPQEAQIKIMSRYIRPIIIAAAVLVVLCAVLVILLVTTTPKSNEEGSNLSNVNMSNAFDFLDDEENMSIVIGVDADKFSELVFTNENGSYSLTRNEDNWQVNGIGNVTPDDSLAKRSVERLAGLMGTEIAHEISGDDLEQFGLKDPPASILFKQSDGSELTLSLGIMNPRKTGSIYCMVGSEGDVFSVDYGYVDLAFADPRYFAELVMNEDDGQLDSVYITRSDAGTDFEIQYMLEYDDLPEDVTVTTTNSYRFTEPIRAEVDSQRSSALYLNLCGLRMNSCEYLEKSEEDLKVCGLDEPLATVKFIYNGEERLLTFGNEFTKETDSDGKKQYYYVMLDDAEGIFSREKRRAVWCTFNVFDSISKRLLSPYIYGCESVEITTPDGEYKFVVDEPNKWFLLDGEPVDSYRFRQLYSKLIEEVGDEYYTEAASEKPELRVKFNYTEKYAAIYGTNSDELSYSDNDGRRYAVTFNGNTLFKVNRLYVQGIIDDVRELVNN